MTRIAAVLTKEALDLRQNPGVLFPAVLTGAITIFLPFLVALVIPLLTGEPLSDSSDFEVALETYRADPSTTGLGAEGAIQAWLFQQFLIVLVFVPITTAMSVAAYSVIGEKLARTLEPLLATPLTTFELLAAKVLGAVIPAIVLTIACFALYVLGVAVFADVGVWWTLLQLRPLALVFLLGPLAALAALQMAVCVSSRVNDARSAQQVGALVVLPIAGLLVVMLMGRLQMTLAMIAVMALVLLVVNLALLRLGISLFDRESILTRWK